MKTNLVSANTPKKLPIKGKAFIVEQGISLESAAKHVETNHYMNFVDVEEPKPEEPDIIEIKKRAVKFNWWKADMGQLAFGSDARGPTDAERKLGPGLAIYFR
mgnify:CR=1 FL=1